MNSGQKYHLNIDVNDSNDSHVMEIRFIEPNTSVLDVGCACGDLGKVLKANKSCLMYGLDCNPESCKIARETGVYKEVKQCDIDKLNLNSFPDYKSKFDCIVCGDVLEHLRNPQQALQILKTYLKQGGYIVASIPNVAHTSIKANLLVNDFTYTELGLLDETHIHLFTYKSIAWAFASAGLEIKECGFTFMPKMGWQPNNPYLSLSDSVQNCIFQDWHSYVCQYIVKVFVSEETKPVLFDKNTAVLDIDEENAPEYIKKYREQQLFELENAGENAKQLDVMKFDYIWKNTSSLNVKVKELNAAVNNLAETDYQKTDLISEQISDLKEKIKEIHSALDVVWQKSGAKTDSVQTKINSLSDKLLDLQDVMDSVNNNNEAKLDSVQANIEDKMDFICSSFADLKNEIVNVISVKDSSINNLVSNIVSKIDSVNVGVKGQKENILTEIASVKNNVADKNNVLITEIDELKKLLADQRQKSDAGFGKIGGDVTEIANKLNDCLATLNLVDNKYDSLQKQIANNLTQINEIRVTQDVYFQKTRYKDKQYIKLLVSLLIGVWLMLIAAGIWFGLKMVCVF